MLPEITRLRSIQGASNTRVLRVLQVLDHILHQSVHLVQAVQVPDQYQAHHDQAVQVQGQAAAVHLEVLVEVVGKDNYLK